jgi:protein-tyrosine-phosphatase
LYYASGGELHPALSGVAVPVVEQQESLPAVRILFLCTQNSARSQMAEGLLRSRSRGRIEAFSAGTEPSKVHPLAIRVLEEMQIDIRHHRSKSMEEYLDQKFDYIITVCDRAREACPVFPGDPIKIHWSFPDPSAVQGSENEKYSAFRETAIQLNTRIGYLLLALNRGGEAG